MRLAFPFFNLAMSSRLSHHALVSIFGSLAQSASLTLCQELSSCCITRVNGAKTTKARHGDEMVLCLGKQRADERVHGEIVLVRRLGGMQISWNYPGLFAVEARYI